MRAKNVNEVAARETLCLCVIAHNSGVSSPHSDRVGLPNRQLRRSVPSPRCRKLLAWGKGLSPVRSGDNPRCSVVRYAFDAQRATGRRLLMPAPVGQFATTAANQRHPVDAGFIWKNAAAFGNPDLMLKVDLSRQSQSPRAVVPTMRCRTFASPLSGQPGSTGLVGIGRIGKP